MNVFVINRCVWLFQSEPALPWPLKFGSPWLSPGLVLQRGQWRARDAGRSERHAVEHLELSHGLAYVP